MLDVQELLVARGGFEVRVATLRIDPGEAVAVLGRSGAGKTSILHAIAGHVRAGDPVRVSGVVRIDGAPRAAPGTAAWRELLRGPVVLVPQDARAALDPLRALGDQVGALAGCGRVAVRRALVELGIAAADAAAIAARLPHQVSGGQAQRALLAVALLRGARLCLLDEPSSGLDRARVDDLARALAALRAAGAALCIATHDQRLAAAVGARPFRIEDGQLRAGAPADTPFPTATPAPADAEVVAACDGVGVRRGRSWLVEHVDLQLRRGENVALLGPSGAGKSTVGRALAGFVVAARGRVVRPSRRRAVQMLFQDAGVSLTPTRTLASLCSEAAEPGVDVAATAATLGLDASHLARTSAALSGGEQRRAALLRALVARPDLLVLDEPTASLDRTTASRVVDSLLAVRARTGVGMLWITHDDELAAAVAERVVRISGGRT